MPVKEKKQVLTVAEAAKMLGVCPATIRYHLRHKRIKSFKLSSKQSGAYRIPIGEIEKLFKGE
ncbi:helix-turn-helix domain-containing protein [Candidatus Woesearchaeota archaeon]|nr:helix-turn-helix domain-containing protein [Candidatus Woesearchaeota archaeon]